MFFTSNDASSVARGVRCAPRGVAQIKWDILRHVIGEPTVVYKYYIQKNKKRTCESQ